MIRKLLLVSALMVFAAQPATASAQGSETFRAHLTGDQEIPARQTSAVGQAIFRVLPNGEVSYRLIASNIDNVVASHIHCGASDVNGPVVQFLYGAAPAGGGSQNGVLATGTFDPSGKSCGSLSLLDAMEAGLTYVNVHTNDGSGATNTGPGDFAAGEIRGQIRSDG